MTALLGAGAAQMRADPAAAQMALRGSLPDGAAGAAETASTTQGASARRPSDATIAETAEEPRFGATAKAARAAKSESAWKSPSTRRRAAVRQQPASAPVPIRQVGDPTFVRPAGDPVPQEAAPELVPPALPPPAEAKRAKRKDPSDPYEPLGLRLGAFDVLPYVEQSVGYDSNPNLVANAKQGSVTLKSEAGFSARSDWSAHELSADLRGAYYAYPSTPSADRPEGDARVRLRLDVNRDTAVDMGVNASLSTQQPGTLEQPLIGNRRSQVFGAGASLGASRAIGPLTASLRGTIQHFDYGDLDCNGCLETDQSFRNYSDYGGALRFGYEVHPGFRPFVEATADQRVYDQTLGPLGGGRDSVGLTGRVGLAVDFTRLIRGEAAIGYGQRSYDDPRIPALTSPIFDASLIWTPTALTTVTFTAGNSLADTTVATSAGSVTQSFGLEVAHALRRNVTVTAFASTAITRYEGIDSKETGASAGLKLDYKLSRSMVVRTSFTHQRLQSSVPDSDYTANVFLVGLRLQR